MSLPLHVSLLRFWRPTSGGRTVAGTGFLAAGADGKAYALTCAHVANLALGRNKDATDALKSGVVEADLIGRSKVTLDLVAWVAPPPIGIARATAVADIAVFTPREIAPGEPFAPPFRAAAPC